MQRKENRYDENIDTDAFIILYIRNKQRREKHIFHQLFNWMLFNFWPLTEFLKLKYFTELAFGFLIFAKLSSWLKKYDETKFACDKMSFFKSYNCETF